MDIANIDQGDLKASVKFEKGVLVAESHLDTNGLQAKLEIKVPADYFLDELAKAIPGTFDDAVIAMAKAALHNL